MECITFLVIMTNVYQPVLVYCGGVYYLIVNKCKSKHLFSSIA